MIEGFEVITPSLTGSLVEVVSSALEVRRQTTALSTLRRHETQFDGSDVAVLLEAVDVEAELYAFILFVKTGQQTLLWWNRTVTLQDGIYRVGEPGKVEEKTLNDREAAKAKRVLEDLQFEAGTGGNPGVFGGDVQLLALRRSGGEKRVILHGYRHAIIDPVYEPATDPIDKARQEAIDAIYTLWADLLT